MTTTTTSSLAETAATCWPKTVRGKAVRWKAVAECMCGWREESTATTKDETEAHARARLRKHLGWEP
jgi:hypothetical protein